ncbi:quinone oxidoreductase family protein [Gordonia neofelifaecis]|uniref:Alcohol dehydrogenase zinc-binding domain-containing protein n=1 Tax=Gordonia neofelifaecis NRRL B-59395 TaxID=644548 RepID=F1YGG5_9ACTN|nr:quinone oxidoreductase [Gordonia neofelifaecis]EGD56112.1 alcohol dehydrogenase zinc-binding domain-containing protein [Gordonia neofelifaecis NRRL B-59395]
MRAIEVSAHGGPEVLTLVELPDPQPAPGEVVVSVHAAGVNFIDTYFRAGMYPSTPPYVPGIEGSGVVTAVGEGVRNHVVGDRVAWCDGNHGYAESVRLRADRVLPVPDAVDLDIAGSSLLRGLTAHYLLDGSARPEDGDTVLVHAGAGGVGLLLTQWAVARGIRVITTVSSDDKERLSREAGASEVLRYNDDIASRVRALTDDRGVPVVYDGVGASTFEQSLAATAVRGTVVLYGAASGPVPPFDLQRLNPAGSLSVTRPTLAHFIADPVEFAWRAGEFFTAVAEGVLTVNVGQSFPLAEAVQAHRALESRSTVGSTMLAVAAGE